LSKIRKEATVRTELYKAKSLVPMIERVNHKQMKRSDLVLTSMESVGKHPMKLGPNWEGPYNIIEELFL